MSAIRDEIQHYIDSLPDKELEALKPILTLLSSNYDEVIIEEDLTAEEKEIIRKAREQYKEEDYVSLEDAKALWSN